MNEKKIFIFIFIISHVIVSLFGFWAGYEVGKSTANTRVKKLESKLSDVLIINSELSEENTKHLETIQRIQGLSNTSTERIQLLESGIAKLKGIGEAKDIRIVEAERRFRELSEEIRNLESKINRDSERITKIFEQFGITNKSDYSRNNSNSIVMWSNYNFNISEVTKWHQLLIFQ
jgi:chromosome segregation ATPase